MNYPRKLATIVVDPQGTQGVCSNCNHPAAIDTTHRTCGATVTGVAIDARYTLTPETLAASSESIQTACPEGVSFVGRGRVIETEAGYAFQLEPKPEGA